MYKIVLLLASGFMAITLWAGQKTVDEAAIVKNYADIAYATYSDSYAEAKKLQQTITRFLRTPNTANLQAARKQWIAARVPYQQSEVFRFGNPWVDEWEGKVNAWPLDEGLIDYVADAVVTEDNPYAGLNIIANAKPRVGGKQLDATRISLALLTNTLQELDGIESNVATGYHAVEFLLWGQDLHGTRRGAGERPASDFDINNCSNGNCERRRDYVIAATELLVSDLADAVAAWSAGGEARKALMAKDTHTALGTMLTGMGSLAFGELAGERINLGLQLHDPEEEHDCFSDNTHASHYYDTLGIRNVYYGQYRRTDGSLLQGPGLAQLLAVKSPQTATLMEKRIEQVEAAMRKMLDAAASGDRFDVLIAEGNYAGNKIVRDVVEALVAETRAIERIVSVLGLDNYETLDSDALAEFKT